MIDTSAFIHPRAHVDDDCEIGPNTKVWQFASVTRKAKIGAGCVIAPGAMIDGSHVGDGSKIGPGAKMGPGFRIGKSVFIGPNVTLCNDMWPEAGGGGFEMAWFQKDGAVTIIIKDGASIGANAVILPGVTIGRNAFVAAGSVCGKDVPDEMLFMRDGTMRRVPERRIRVKRISC